MSARAPRRSIAAGELGDRRLGKERKRILELVLAEPWSGDALEGASAAADGERGAGEWRIKVFEVAVDLVAGSRDGVGAGSVREHPARQAL